MKILHISPHAGGGVGTVLMGWIDNDNINTHEVALLDSCNEKFWRWIHKTGISGAFFQSKQPLFLEPMIQKADIVVVHFWDHPMLIELLTRPLPACRMVFWIHKNYDIPVKYLTYPDRVLGTSPIQKIGEHIWSTGDMTRFFSVQPKPHEGFVVGTVLSPKLHPQFKEMCYRIESQIPEKVTFLCVGESGESYYPRSFDFTGAVDDTALYFAKMDVFGYPLRPDHYGTCEQVMGEAMAAGLPVVAFDNPAERCIIYHGINGVLVGKQGGPEEYCQRVVSLYHNFHAREELGTAARKQAEVIYNVRAMVTEWELAFVTMIETPKTQKGGLFAI